MQAESTFCPTLLISFRIKRPQGPWWYLHIHSIFKPCKVRNESFTLYQQTTRKLKIVAIAKYINNTIKPKCSICSMLRISHFIYWYTLVNILNTLVVLLHITQAHLNTRWLFFSWKNRKCTASQDGFLNWACLTNSHCCVAIYKSVTQTRH